MPVIEVPIRAQTRRRVRMRLPVVIAMWAVCVFATGWLSSATRIGPVVYTFSSRHGIHAADLALAVVLAAAASFATWLLLRPSPRDRTAADLEVVAVEVGRIPAIIAVWISSMVVWLWVAFDTEIGPVIFVYNNHRSARLGEMVAGALIVLVAGWTTARLLRPAPVEGPSSGR